MYAHTFEKAVDQGRNRERSYVSKDKKTPPEKASQLQSNRSQGFQTPRSSESKRNHLKGMSHWKWVEKWTASLDMTARIVLLAEGT